MYHERGPVSRISGRRLRGSGYGAAGARWYTPLVTTHPLKRAATPGVRTWLARLRTRLGSLVYDALPMTLEEREERDWTGEPSARVAERHQLQVRLLILERGGGGLLF